MNSVKNNLNTIENKISDNISKVENNFSLKEYSLTDVGIAMSNLALTSLIFPPLINSLSQHQSTSEMLMGGILFGIIFASNIASVNLIANQIKENEKTL